MVMKPLFVGSYFVRKETLIECKVAYLDSETAEEARPALEG